MLTLCGCCITLLASAMISSDSASSALGFASVAVAATCVAPPFGPKSFEVSGLLVKRYTTKSWNTLALGLYEDAFLNIKQEPLISFTDHFTA